ncbi:MAG: hypothetical protein ACRET3_06300 [Burkholderiales bacterium]
MDFEAGYMRHLAWHHQAGDPWVWYGWSIWAGERQRWFVYATFGHSAGSLDSSVAPAEPDGVNPLVVKVTTEILNLRPTMSYRLGSATRR